MKPNQLLQQQGVQQPIVNNNQAMINQQSVQTQANQEKELSPKEKIIFELQRNKDKFKEALPKIVNVDQYLRIVYNALNEKPELQKCTLYSFMSCVLKAATLGLEVNNATGEAYIIPYRTFDKNTRQFIYLAQLQIGYRGLIRLAYNSQMVKDIFASEVCENDLFKCVYGSNRALYHEINYRKNRGPIQGYYADVRLNNGGEVFFYMKVNEMEDYRKQNSPQSNTEWSPWKTHYTEMAKKTVLKKVLKLIPLNNMLAQGIGVDNMIGNQNNTMKYADARPEEKTPLNEKKQKEITTIDNKGAENK